VAIADGKLIVDVAISPGAVLEDVSAMVLEYGVPEAVLDEMKDLVLV